MGAVEDAVKAMIEDRFGTVTEFARTYNLNEQTLHSLFSKGSFGKSRMENIIPITHALEIDPYWLLQGKIVENSTRFRGYVEVPLYGSIPAGQPIEPVQIDERYPVPQELVDRYPGAFLLRVAGTSMNRVLPNGCYALIEPCASVDYSGWPYAVNVGNADATIKRVVVLGNGLELVPDSTDKTWHPMVFDYADENADEVSVIGRVVWFCIPLNWRFTHTVGNV